MVSVDFFLSKLYGIIWGQNSNPFTYGFRSGFKEIQIKIGQKYRISILIQSYSVGSTTLSGERLVTLKLQGDVFPWSISLTPVEFS